MGWSEDYQKSLKCDTQFSASTLYPDGKDHIGSMVVNFVSELFCFWASEYANTVTVRLSTGIPLVYSVDNMIAYSKSALPVQMQVPSFQENVVFIGKPRHPF